jgi:predicted transcriptional regulator
LVFIGISPSSINNHPWGVAIVHNNKSKTRSTGGDTVFDHETRKMIYNHVLTYPGVSYLTLKNIYNLTAGTLRYHLEYLIKADRILVGIENGKRCYYPLKNDVVVSDQFGNRPSGYSLTKTQQKILNTIKQTPGITQKELIRKTNLSRFRVGYNINKFIELGFVKKSNNGKHVIYEYMTDELLKHEILLRLAMKLLNKEIDEKTFNELKDKLIG